MIDPSFVFDPILAAIFGFMLGYFFKDQIGKGILRKSKVFTEAFSVLMLIMVIYVLYRFDVFEPFLSWINS